MDENQRFRPPKSVVKAAQNAEPSEEAVANLLSSGEPLDYKTIKLLSSFKSLSFSNELNPWVNKLLAKFNTSDKFTYSTEILKFDEELGLVLGYAIICTKDGEPYFDLQEDNIPEDSMMKAAVDFMQNSRSADEMHDFETMGTVVFAWPMTEDIAKAFDIETNTTGLMIAMKPSDSVLEKFKSGEYTGFSIGGTRLVDEPFEED